MTRTAEGARRRESGFALLFVFAMAAIVSVMLYLEMPRVAFEAQRVREQMLIDRGEQYARAIKLYMRKFPGKYPASIEQLENTNNIRFLRRRYKDPMTGSDEWRIIHAGPGGIMTDSLVQKPPQTKDSQFGASIGTPIGSSDQTASSDSTAGAPSMMPRLRQSERGGQVIMPGFSGGTISGEMNPGEQTQMNPREQTQQEQPAAQYPSVVQPGQPVQFQPGQPVQPGLVYAPGQQSFQPGQPIQFGQPGQPGQPYPVIQPGMQPGMQPQPGIQPGQPSYGQAPGQPAFGPAVPGLPVGPQQGMSPPTLLPAGPPNQTGTPPVPTPGVNPPDPSQPQQSPTPGATPVPEMIRNMLTQPRTQTGFGMGGQTIGGGIAGVASKLEAQGIKVYNDRTKYNEWEFVYDPRKDITNPLMMGQQPGLAPTGPQTGFQPGPGPQPGPK